MDNKLLLLLLSSLFDCHVCSVTKEKLAKALNRKMTEKWTDLSKLKSIFIHIIPHKKLLFKIKKKKLLQLSQDELLKGT
jgi:hypothetical protein